MGNAVKYAVYEFMSTRVMHFAFRGIEYYSSRRFLYDARACMLRCALVCPVVCNHGDGAFVCLSCEGFARHAHADISEQLRVHVSRPRPAMPSFPRCKRDTNANEHDFLRCERCDASWCATCWWRSDALATYCGDDGGCAACVQYDPREINCDNAPRKFIYANT